MKRITIIGLLFAASVFPHGCWALGVFEDFFETSIFLSSPMQRSIEASLLRTDEGEVDGSGFFLRAAYPLRGYFLLGLEGSYLVLAGEDDVSAGFGDFRFLGRATLFQGGGKTLYLTGSFRTGSGTTEVYPFASASFDVEFGAAFMDSLELFTLWGSLKGGSVHSAPKNLDENSRHDDYAVAVLGMTLPVSDRFRLGLGGAGYFAEAGSREIYFLGMENPYSESMSFFSSFQAEGGDADKRIFDFSLQAGVRIFY